MRERALWPAVREYWHPVTFAENVGDRPVAARLLGEDIAVCRLGERWAAFADLCVHRGTPISLGWIEGERVVCAYHGWAYDPDGRCVRIPSLPPDHSIPKKACLTAYLAEERYGIVWVCLSRNPRAPIPDFPALEDPEFQITFRDQRVWRCSAARAMENFFDLGHFSWVHEGILGDRSRPITPKMRVERAGESLRFRYTDPPAPDEPFPHYRNYILYRPFSIYQLSEFPNGKTIAVVSPHGPQTEKICTRFLMTATRVEPGSPADSESNQAAFMEDRLIEGQQIDEIIAEQDRVIVENQRPEEIPLDLAEELHLKVPDTLALAYRRFLLELGVE